MGDARTKRLSVIVNVTKEEADYRAKLYPDVSCVEESKINCTVCCKDLKYVVFTQQISYKHEFLQVVLCKRCKEFYGTGNFSEEEDGDDKYCRWCGQGGSLYLCSCCPSAFCKKCIKHNFDRHMIVTVEKDDWKCFFCNPKPLFKLRALAWAIDVHLDSIKKKTPKSTKSKFPNLTLSESEFLERAEEVKHWLSDLCIDSVSPGAARLAECRRAVERLSSVAELANVVASLHNLAEQECKKWQNFQRDLTSGLVSLQGDIGTRTSLSVRESNLPALAEGGDPGDCSSDDVLESSVPNVIRLPDGDDKENECSTDRPAIRLRNFSELINPALVGKKLVSRKKLEKDTELITLSSDEETAPIKKRRSEEHSGSHKTESSIQTPPSLREVSNSVVCDQDDSPSAEHNFPTETPRLSDTETAEKSADSDSPRRDKKGMYFTESDSDKGSLGRVSNEKSEKSSSRSTEDTVSGDEESLLRKPAKGVKTLKSKPSNADRTARRLRVDSSSWSDMDIEKLCDMKSLRPNRGLALDNSDSSSSQDRSEKISSSKKTAARVERLSDFYDSGDNGARDNCNDEDDIETAFLQVCPRFADQSTVEDLKASILNMSSSDAEKTATENRKEKKEPAEGRKNKLKSRSESSSQVGKSRKKRYADKLMRMKVVSDSDSEGDLERKYRHHKMEQEAKGADESCEDGPLVAKKPVPKRSRKAKKMFSDSEISSIESDGTEKALPSEGSDDETQNSNNDKRSAPSDSSDSSFGRKKKQTKRRRIKRASSSNNDSDDAADKSMNETAKGRKNIRRVLKEDDLKQTTQAALKSEQERKKRILEKQKLYNQLVGKVAAEHEELKELVLDFNSKTKENLVVVNPDLVKKLKPHQAEGVKFMWDSCFETLEMAKTKNGSGCILAHCMGLGKSLQVVTLIHTLLTNPQTGVRTVLVVAPLSTVLNWVNEFDKWLKDIGSGDDVNVFHLSKTQANYRAFLLKDWYRSGGVLIMGYNLLRALSNPKGRMKAAFKKVFQEKLLDPGPDVVICDEGHILKNEKTALSISMSKMKTRRRIVLTGTPLQNNLVEYHCMVQFVKPNLLGTKKEFTNRFVNPIQNGQFEDSTPHDVKVMKRRAHVLHTMLDGLVQRKDYRVLTPYLPPKFEYVIHLKLSDIQVKLYRHYLLNVLQCGDGESTAPKGRRLFVDFQNLMWICLHPRTLLMKSEKDDKKAEHDDDSEDEEGSLKDFIDDDQTSSSGSDVKSISSGSAKSVDSSSSQPKLSRRTRRQGLPSDQEESLISPAKRWWSDLLQEEHMDDIRQSSKLFLFFTILKYCEDIGDKLLVFSQSLYALDIIEYFLDKIDSESQYAEENKSLGIKGFEGSWTKGLDYFRLDGSSACENRESWCKTFNRSDNTRARLFLISTRAGGLGINLTGANRVVIFDASWNPSFDVQSLFRVYRFGQGKPCYIYRFLSKGTMEEKVYERQVAKLSTSLRVIDEQQIDRHFSHSALADLYMFDPEGSELQGTPVLPKDRLMAELVQNHKDIILSHHQHDSLLENQEDQELTEEERKAAWTEFESEKNQTSLQTMTLGSVATTLVRIRMSLEQQNPSWTEDQLRLRIVQILQKQPDFHLMAPFVGVLFDQWSIQKNNLQYGGQSRPTAPSIYQQAPSGAAPYTGTLFPRFQYPAYSNYAPSQPGTSGAPSNPLMEQVLNYYKSQTVPDTQMITNPKHASSQIEGINSSVIELNDSGPVEEAHDLTHDD